MEITVEMNEQTSLEQRRKLLIAAYGGEHRYTPYMLLKRGICEKCLHPTLKKKKDLFYTYICSECGYMKMFAESQGKRFTKKEKEQIEKEKERVFHGSKK